MQIQRVDPRIDPIWRKLVDRSESSVFHSPSWLRVLADTYGFELGAAVVVDTTGEPRAGIPFCHITDCRGERLICMPFSDYCDPLVDGPDTWNSLVDYLECQSRHLLMRCLHNHLPVADERLIAIKWAKWHGLTIGSGVDALWGALPSSSRRAIRRAQTAGVTIRAAETIEDLRAFYTLHVRMRKYKYRLLAQPYSFFENIWHHFIEKSGGRLLLAVSDGEIIAGVMYLQWKDGLYYKFNASSLSHLEHRPNDLLTWAGIEYAATHGLGHIDFGLSDWDQEGLIRYKRKYANEEKTISFLESAASGRVNGATEDTARLLGQLTELLTDPSVPDTLTERAGSLLYRHFA